MNAVVIKDWLDLSLPERRSRWQEMSAADRAELEKLLGPEPLGVGDPALTASPPAAVTATAPRAEIVIDTLLKLFGGVLVFLGGIGFAHGLLESEPANTGGGALAIVAGFALYGLGKAVELLDLIARK